MSLFACEKCKTVENTATSDYWYNLIKKLPKLCSECETGKWHGEFPKKNAIEEGCYTDGKFVFYPHEVSERNGKLVWTYNPFFKMKGKVK